MEEMATNWIRRVSCKNTTSNVMFLWLSFKVEQNVYLDISPLKACNPINGKIARQTQIFHCPPPTGKYKRKARITDLGFSAFNNKVWER